MKKLFSVSIASLMLFFVSTTGFSQAFSKSDKLLNAGLAIGTYGYGGIGFGGTFEFGVTDDISVGPTVGYSGTTDSGYGFSVLSIGGRGSYHFNRLFNLTNDKLDIYAGAGLGYRRVGYDNPYLVGYSYGSGVLLLAHVGIRYYFSDKMGVYGEAGSGVGALQGGITFKF
jgi:hypothetical protein